MHPENTRRHARPLRRLFDRFMAAGKGPWGMPLFTSLKSTHKRHDLSFLGTITRFANQSECLTSRMNLASSNLASSSPMACRLGYENLRNACLTGLKPGMILRLCSARSLRMPTYLMGARQKYPNFRGENHVMRLQAWRPAVFSMETILEESSGWTWNLTTSSPGLKDIDFKCLARMTSSRSTFVRSLDNSSAAKASDYASIARDAVLSLVLNDRSRPPLMVIMPFGPGIFSFMYA